MGATLSSRVEWTSASNKGGKLDFSKTNENILREIVKYVENLCRNNPREAQVVFKHPFVWTSSLGLSNFSSLKSGDDYVLRSVAESAPPPSIGPAVHTCMYIQYIYTDTYMYIYVSTHN